MKLNKIIIPMAISLAALSSQANASGYDCDEECKSSIEFHEKLDEKDQKIEFMKKEMEIQRLANEIAKLKEGETKNEGDNQALMELSQRVDELYSELSGKIETIASEPSSGGLDSEEVIRDTTGIKNVFITATTGVGSDWKAKVYYDNSIQELSVGDSVFPGAVIKSISRRGAVISSGDADHHKNITSSEIAMARSFNNIKEERLMKQQSMEREAMLGQQGPSFIPPY